MSAPRSPRRPTGKNLAPGASYPVPAPPRYRVEELFAGARQLVIVHGEREYCLRLTSANKLILTA
jgi:hemin uptake protein HemP